MKLIFSANKVKMQPSCLESTGTWTWNTPQTPVTLDGAFSIIMVELRANKLRVTMTHERAESNGRADTMLGNYEIMFSAN